MDQEKIAHEVRLLALEYCVALAISKLQFIAIASGATEAQLTEAEQNGIEMFNSTTLPGNHDPVMGDHFMAEFRDAVMSILSSAREMRQSSGYNPA
ncbi:hypothetical protein [Mesorhizobium sp. M0674]|uniref:hypothetical protein n=1 Tax=unclassified Mesorhizobium TaxID=325217 RepID=UPI00333933D3